MYRKQQLLKVTDLSVDIVLSGKGLISVDRVSFDLDEGEILGLVGESGSGKSTAGLAVLGLLEPPMRIAGGNVDFRGRNLLELPAQELRRMHGAEMSMVLQNPMSALNPTLRIGDQMIDAILAHETVSRKDAWKRSRDALGRMGVPSPEERMAAYPHQFSGGMRQRIVIATALLNRPSLIIADEPTTALDVTVQAQILHEVRHMCSEQRTALIWITHDLAVVAGLADRLAVMYAGKIVEQGSVDQVLDRPAHPYTRGLIASATGPHREQKRFFQIPGLPPKLEQLPPGCRFAPRCSEATELCRSAPQSRLIEEERRVSCHHVTTKLPLEPECGVTG
ncbi:ABC transporter ATP-binding protein [Ochrobactrum vermis]|uniref:ABC transporter ATP-binding protein n=1 Tax=Ochrobactrum vermis TaxID=1827297 RepID=A0ABU8PFQ6_9HYPH|nr:ABC transporter ATP-binding protein [Ochrobactrum vermis]PQZ27054.1 methionine ABC transporter ATP-binding protein [Ochrobactrum vermis]